MSEMVSSIKEQSKAILVMMTLAIVSVLAMVVLGEFKMMAYEQVPDLAVQALTNTTIDLFVTAFGITGSFAAITVLIIVVKVIIGVVKGLKT